MYWCPSKRVNFSIVTVDVLFFRRRVWARLMSNIGIVLVFVALYVIFVKRS